MPIFLWLINYTSTTDHFGKYTSPKAKLSKEVQWAKAQRHCAQCVQNKLESAEKVHYYKQVSSTLIKLLLHPTSSSILNLCNSLS